MNPRPTRLRAHRSERASVLVICMVLAALGTLGVLAWASLLDARSHQVEAGFAALQRRTERQNSEAIARMAIQRNLIHANGGLAADRIYELPGIGKATVRAYSATPLLSNTAGVPARNGATPQTSNTTNVAVDIHVGSARTTSTYRLRNLHPALGGDLLVIHPYEDPAITPSGAALPLVSGKVQVKGRAVFWKAAATDLGAGLAADEFLINPLYKGSTTTLSDTSGNRILPLNYPFYYRTTGRTTSGPAHNGQLELMDGAVNPQNSYQIRTTGGLFLSGNVVETKSAGPATRPATADDPSLLAYISANPASAVAAKLATYSNLSSAVLVAAVGKGMTNAQLHQVFNAQTAPPDDALSQMMGTLDQATLTAVLERSILDMNLRFGALYNTDGKGGVTLYLGNAGLDRVRVGEVGQLRLVGQANAIASSAAAALPPLLVAVDDRNLPPGANLAQIKLFDENHRALALAIAHEESNHLSTAIRPVGNNAYPVWRCVLDLQNTSLTFDSGSVMQTTLRGGIRMNRRLLSTGALVIERDPQAEALAPLLSRDAWIEISRQ